MLQTPRIGLVHFPRPSVRLRRQGAQGLRFLQVNHEIELKRQRGQEIVAHALGFRSIDDADGPLQVFHAKCRDRIIFRPQIDKKTLLFQGGKQFLVTAGQGGRMVMVSAGPSQSEAAVTLPRLVENPTRSTLSP